MSPAHQPSWAHRAFDAASITVMLCTLCHLRCHEPLHQTIYFLSSGQCPPLAWGGPGLLGLRVTNTSAVADSSFTPPLLLSSSRPGLLPAPTPPLSPLLLPKPPPLLPLWHLLPGMLCAAAGGLPEEISWLDHLLSW